MFISFTELFPFVGMLVLVVELLSKPINSLGSFNSGISSSPNK